MNLLPVYTVISFSLPYIYSILLNSLIYNRRKRKSPQIQVFVRGTKVDDNEAFLTVNLKCCPFTR